MDDGAAQPQVVADGVQEPLRDRADLLVTLPVGFAHARLLELFELGVEVGAPPALAVDALHEADDALVEFLVGADEILMPVDFAVMIGPEALPVEDEDLLALVVVHLQARVDAPQRLHDPEDIGVDPAHLQAVRELQLAVGGARRFEADDAVVHGGGCYARAPTPLRGPGLSWRARSPLRASSRSNRLARPGSPRSGSAPGRPARHTT
jgi:hypothetical protein